MNLFKLRLEERECKVLNRISLMVHLSLEKSLEEHVRNINFSRISLSDRCLTIAGKSFSFETGYDWEFVFNTSQSGYN